jgi:hypothetical protein
LILIRQLEIFLASIIRSIIWKYIAI